jgi:hypothetical protein
VRHSKRIAGGALVQLLLLLVLLAGAGGYNYYRNMMLEQQDNRPRPFKGYATTDLESLRDAYTGEAARSQKRYDSRDQSRVRASGEGLIDQRLDEFERIQHNSSALREIGGQVAEQEARVREIEEELQYRSSLKSGMDLHLKRLLTI